MDDFIHFLAAVAKVSVGLCVAVVVFVYLAYATESRCWHPTGCVNTSQEARDMHWAADHVGYYGGGDKK